jgi:HAD superfamily hydrolase (TIGR01484 family)
MTLRLVAVDLDGTLLGGTPGRYGFLPSGVAALQQVAQLPARVAIATGRHMEFILALLQREGVDPATAGWPHIIVAEERLVYEWHDGSYQEDLVWNKQALAAELASYDIIRAGVDQLLTGELAEIDATVHKPDQKIEQARGFVEVIFRDAAASRRGATVLQAWLEAEALPYVAVRNVAGVAIRHKSIGKGPVLAYVCRKLQIDPGETLVMGDSENDLSMLTGFGFLASVPANAEPEVQNAVIKAGGFVAAGRYGDGVADAISRLVLQKGA